MRFSAMQGIYIKMGLCSIRVFFRDDRDMMGADVSGTEIEIGREEEKSVLCMGHFLTSPASLIQIYSLSQQTLTFLSRFFFF